ncbi:zinc finger CCHC domain-containing protein 8 [Aplysia californica]|uniref:Zinc finger CCHC domain-containing protein 8 n=1 Tax=Aplysia californica TaxID=6500 RepID=A0ABM1A206_APLCA|nr:zinc finger CCHC domain-containing protein 8 [Aplysia californica]
MLLFTPNWQWTGSQPASSFKMADFFGDASLFAEFEKDREADASFIHYDETTSQSRIVFEGLASEEEDESDSEWMQENTDAKAGSDVEMKSETKEDVAEEDSKSNVNLDKNNEESSSKVKEPATDKSKNGTANKSSSSKEPVKMLDDDDTAWLYEHLYSEGTDSQDTKPNVQQLIYDRNKYHRYSKILDSTRYVPDDESPAVQLLFNNNAFARKYRQQIEQFIKGLLWTEFHTNNPETVSEITSRPGDPSCVDINEKLTPDLRTEKMRQKHTILGNGQFHKQFLIDFLGWPFTVKEPPRCNVNWEIPVYGQVFDEVYADPSSKQKKQDKKKTKPSCWNCGQENHSVAECRMPRNPARIAANRKEFMEKQQEKRSEPKFTGAARYHLDPELASKFGKFRPGVISDSLREALGLNSDQMPQHIYKMRLFGYPPGWLAVAKQVESGVSIFDKNGQATRITGQYLEDGELDDEGAAEDKNEYDVNKIIEYPGFTVPVPLGIVDEHATYQMPPIQQHQLKKTLMSQSDEKAASARKRKRSKPEEGQTDEAGGKKSKSEQEEGEVDNENSEEKEEGDTQPLSPDATPESTKTALNKSSSTISLSRAFGTPILVREKSSLPDATKFGVGIEDHINFENLPDSTGTFEKMRNLISIIRDKIKK